MNGKKICKQCGGEFTPARPYYVICFTCHLASIRQGITDRRQLFAPAPRHMLNLSKASKQNGGK